LGRDSIPSFLLDEWGRSTPRALVVRWLDFLLLLFFFLHPRVKKKRFQRTKNKGEKYERKRVRERPRAEEEEEEEERHNDRFFFGSRLLLFFVFRSGLSSSFAARRKRGESEEEEEEEEED